MKELTKIPDDINLLAPSVLEPMLNLKHELNTGNRLTLPEILTALSICSTTNPIVEKAINNLKKLKKITKKNTDIKKDCLFLQNETLYETGRNYKKSTKLKNSGSNQCRTGIMFILVIFRIF